MAKQGKMTRNAKAFMAANLERGVVQGNVLGPSGGCFYVLKGGKSFTLTASECRAVGEVYWHGINPPPVQAVEAPPCAAA